MLISSYYVTIGLDKCVKSAPGRGSLQGDLADSVTAADHVLYLRLLEGFDVNCIFGQSISVCLVYIKIWATDAEAYTQIALS